MYSRLILKKGKNYATKKQMQTLFGFNVPADVGVYYGEFFRLQQRQQK
jgi:hypothetical protein